MPQVAIFLQAFGLSPSSINIVMFGLLLIIFYFFLIRPQAQRQKKQASFQDGIKKGDQVVTTSGIMGRVSKVDTDAKTVMIEASKGTYLELTQASISRELTEATYGEREVK